MKAERQPIEGILRDVIVDVTHAIGDELAALASADNSAVSLHSGRHISSCGRQHLWSFDLDGPFPVLPETPGQLVVSGRPPVPAIVLAVGDLDVVLGVEDEMGETLAAAELSVQPWFILDALRNRLEAALETGGDAQLLSALLDLDDADTSRAVDTDPLPVPLPLGDDQRQAARHAARPGLRFVWGPPGTGKTSTVAATTALLATEPPRRVLVVAHANAAIDVAITRIADALGHTPLVAEGRVLRVGTPHLESVRNRPDVLPDQILARHHPEEVRRRGELEQERRSLSGRMKRAATTDARHELAGRLDGIRAELADIDRRLREERVALIKNATVIATTLSKFVLDELIWTWPSDAVVVDEASMAGLPFVVATALRGASTLACFGDFRQLPPIAVSERRDTRRWFARDVFEVAGVVSRFDDGIPDHRLATLRTQYRMGPAIASVIGKLAYYDLLATHESAIDRAAELAGLRPAAGCEIVIVDTSALDTTCLQEADPRSFSRFNLVSALITAALARGLVDDGSPTVGVVCPYRAQARLLDALLRDSEVTTAATTHRFQGWERDAVLLDLTDARPQKGPSLLTGRDPDLALRLVNVGASRARGKLLVVADLDFLTSRHPTTSPARALIDLAEQAGAATLHALDLVREIGKEAAHVSWRSTWHEAVTELVTGRWDADERLDLNVPTARHAGAWLDEVAKERPPKHPVTVRAPAPVAAQLESTPVELRLRTLGPAPVAFLGDAAMVAGSPDPTKPAAIVRHPPFVLAAQRRLMRD